MLLFATRSANVDKLNTHCIPGIRASMGESYNHLTAKSDSEDIFPTLDRFMRKAREERDVEALVLLHDDLELRDPHFASKVRAVFKDPSVAVIGCIGAKGVTSLNWWEGSPRYGHTVDGLNGAYEWGFDGDPSGVGPVDVDSVDGMMLILSPWAIANLALRVEGCREDVASLGYSGLHGYAEELCFQARAVCKRVVVTRFELTHHTKGGIAGDWAGYARSNANFKRRWFPTQAHPPMPDGVSVQGCSCTTCTWWRPTPKPLDPLTRPLKEVADMSDPFMADAVKRIEDSRL